MTFHNRELEALVPRGAYRVEDVSRIEAALRRHGTLTFEPLPSGLFPASVGPSAAGSGYANVWVRDNVHVAYAHHLAGSGSVAAGVVHALLTFFSRYRHRFEDIAAGLVDPRDVSMRPHVRFDGRSLREIDAPWAHAQNDALGYFLWLYAELAMAGAQVALDHPALTTLELFPRYFEAIRYWEDEDSGHWEEARRVSASSIGVVVAGLSAVLRAARTVRAFRQAPFDERSLARAADLVDHGRAALGAILPHECAQIVPGKNRRYDAALLFLLFPLDVVGDGAMARLLLDDVDRILTGEVGIRRYLGDSYWAPDYETRLPRADWSRDFSRDVSARDVLLERIGEEAQWCLFDPLLSAYYGRRALIEGRSDDIERQAYHFTRSLAQITHSWRCPELYYLRRGEYVPNPHVPLLWTQANLAMALHFMRATA